MTKGIGINGMTVSLTLGDMFAIFTVAKEVENVIKAKNLRGGYLKTPYDQRKENYPKGEPEDKNLDVETLDKIHALLCKMSYACGSDAFTPNTGADFDIDEDEE